MEVLAMRDDTFFPVKLVRGWRSMIWTERFLTHGEFELRTPRIAEAINTMPEDTLITLRDSEDVMQVEDITIEANEDGIEEAVVSGRSFEAPLLEGRYLAQGPYREAWKMPTTYTAGEAAGAVIWDSLCNTTNWSVLKPTYGNDPKNVVPRLQIQTTNEPDVSNVEWWLENGPVYPTVLDFLTRGGLGMRLRRPLVTVEPTSVVRKFSFAASGSVVTAVNSSNTNFLHFDLFKGVDRSNTQYDRPKVVFDWRSEDLDRPRYLWSSRNLMQVVYVGSTIGGVFVYADDSVSPYLTGRKRRSMYIEGGDPGDIPHSEFISGLVQQGEIALKKHNRVAVMDSGVKASAHFKYGEDYFMGDFVTLRGKYGFNQKMQVTEFVRSSDGTVDQGFPTLTLPT